MSVKLKNILRILLIWFIAGLLYSAQSYYYRIQIGQDVDAIIILLVDLPYFLFWAVFTPIPLYFFKHIPFSKNSLLKFFSVHITVAVVVSFIHAFLYNAFRLFINGNDVTLSRTYINAVASFDYGLLVYFIVLLAIGVYDYYIRFQKLQMTLIQSQLETVRTRLQPHFLFNTLNSVAVLIKENPGQAHNTIKDLSDLLRHVLKNMENQFSEVEKEFEFIKKYLAIEQIRFGPRLEIEIDCPATLNKLLIPSLLLQPLVENAVQYGVAGNRGKGYIEISAQKEKDKLIFQIFNNGHIQPAKNSDSSLGLKITKERLRSLYGSAYQFKLDEISDQRIRAMVEIPLIEEVVK